MAVTLGMGVRGAIARRNPGRLKAVFLDKDGTLLQNVPYNVDPSLMRLLPGAGEALRLLQEAGYALVVVTNQSGIARGSFPAAALDGVEARLRQLLAPFGVDLTAFYACPHHPAGSVAPYARECECRKPRPGLLLRAAAELGIDLRLSWMLGDILDDVEAGCRAGCRTALLVNGGESEWLAGPCRTPDLRATGPLTAARHIIDVSMGGKEQACDATSSS